MNKKQKQIIGISTAVLIIIILTVAFYGKGSSSAFNENVNLATLNEKEKYAMFSAEVACELIEIIQNLDENNTEPLIQETLKINQEAANKYGYTLSEVETKRIQYAADAKFQSLAQEYILNLCPEILTEAQLQE